MYGEVRFPVAVHVAVDVGVGDIPDVTPTLATVNVTRSIGLERSVTSQSGAVACPGIFGNVFACRERRDEAKRSGNAKATRLRTGREIGIRGSKPTNALSAVIPAIPSLEMPVRRYRVCRGGKAGRVETLPGSAQIVSSFSFALSNMPNRSRGSSGSAIMSRFW